jgi:cystathionine beta-lyase family protein involved in aluminum resistance
LSEQDRIQQEYAADLIPPLFEMAKHENQKYFTPPSNNILLTDIFYSVKREVADFVIAFCENLSDPDPLVPYLSDLLDVMYGYLKCESSSVRSKATTAISSLIITCSTSFMKVSSYRQCNFC